MCEDMEMWKRKDFWHTILPSINEVKAINTQPSRILRPQPYHNYITRQQQQLMMAPIRVSGCTAEMATPSEQYRNLS
jgi:hypothetical protein